MKVLFYILFIFLLSGCAATYKTFTVEQFPYKELQTENPKIDYATRQGVMFNTNNFKYAKREQKQAYNLIAFKIVNKSTEPINVSDFKYSCGGATVITPISMDTYIKENKQKAGLYWLYLGLVSPNPFMGKNGLGKVIPVGAAPAIINFALAHKANKKMKQNIGAYDLTNKVIQPNDTIYGILPFKGSSNCGDIFITLP
ncbi:MAG TPA: hypothetical protein PLC61_02395 [Chitinophagales bacterium]|nr:hypothetical protein [Chitinophagales bacterium]HMZ68992.1 hypothetical protein [Chitinophagales bacterium]HND45237.1 hypothetical protein [Chitinophagales bacterium]HNG08250.1 hypothetical protein [Chitinophagales bacterium]HNK90364.1 hypothetical protein [Chitinophagales bacterium]